MTSKERNILIGLMVAIILMGILALSIVQYQANNAAIVSVDAAATHRQFQRDLERTLTPDG